MQKSTARFIRLLGDMSLIVITVVALVFGSNHRTNTDKYPVSLQYSNGLVDVQLLPPRMIQRNK